MKNLFQKTICFIVAILILASASIFNVSAATPATYDQIRSFDDVSALNYWAGIDIYRALARGYISGTGPRTFSPDSPITNAQFAKMVSEAFCLKQAAMEGPFDRYSDISIDAWYYSYVYKLNSAYRPFYTVGEPGFYFKPNSFTTRQDFISTLMRIIGEVDNINDYPAVDLDNLFTDSAGILQENKPSVETAVRIGIMKGSDGKLNPNGTITRAEAVIFIERVLYSFYCYNDNNYLPYQLVPAGTDNDSDVMVTLNTSGRITPINVVITYNGQEYAFPISPMIDGTLAFAAFDSNKNFLVGSVNLEVYGGFSPDPFELEYGKTYQATLVCKTLRKGTANGLPEIKDLGLVDIKVMNEFNSYE